ASPSGPAAAAVAPPSRRWSMPERAKPGGLASSQGDSEREQKSRPQSVVRQHQRRKLLLRNVLVVGGVLDSHAQIDRPAVGNEDLVAGVERAAVVEVIGLVAVLGGRGDRREQERRSQEPPARSTFAEVVAVADLPAAAFEVLPRQLGRILLIVIDEDRG